MPHPLAEFYRGKRLLVTGHTAFESGWLVAWLKLLGAEVCAYGPPPSSRPNFFDVTLLDRGIRSIFGDLRDREALANAFADFQPEMVIHAAAQPGTRSEGLDAAEVFSRNAMGSTYLLEEARLSRSVRAMVIHTGDACYEHRNWFWGAREEDPLGAHDAYGGSLAATELISSAFRARLQNTALALGSARMSDGIGGGDWEPEHPVPTLVHALTSKQRVTPGPDKVAVWHVLDRARACLLLGKTLFDSGPRFSGAWNFGPSDRRLMSERELAEQFIQHWGAGELAPAGKEAAPAAGGAVPLNTRKAEIDFAWRPALTPEEAIVWTVDWYRGFYADPRSAWRLTEDQLDRYSRLTAAGAVPLSARADPAEKT